MKHQLEGIVRLSSVAVIGASTRKGTIGRETLHNILMAEFHGKDFLDARFILSANFNLLLNVLTIFKLILKMNLLRIVQRREPFNAV